MDEVRTREGPLNGFGRSSNHTQGFALIELAIVVIVIGLLAAIALPQFSHVKAHLNETDLFLSNLPIGRVVFNSPEEMEIGETKSIRVLLSLTKTIEELTRELRSTEKVEGGDVAVADRVEARLTGQGFSILAATPETQAVSMTQQTEWTWDVEAKTVGEQQLHLTLSTMVSVKGTQTPRVLRTFDRTIYVTVKWTSRVKDFIANNWQWLWATIVVPVGGWLWHLRRKKKKPKKPKK